METVKWWEEMVRGVLENLNLWGIARQWGTFCPYRDSELTAFTKAVFQSLVTYESDLTNLLFSDSLTQAPFHPPRWSHLEQSHGRCWHAGTVRSISGFYCIRMCHELSHIHFKHKQQSQYTWGRFNLNFIPFENEMSIDQAACWARSLVVFD